MVNHLKIKNKFSRPLLLGVCFLVVFSFFNLENGFFNQGEKGTVETGGQLGLVRPVFAQGASSTFPEDEVGISCYVKVDGRIDLVRLKGALQGVRAEGSNYVIGLVSLPGLPSEFFPHVYVNSDGWIVVYYSKNVPTSRIVQWHGYAGGKITTTTLEDALAEVCRGLGIGYSKEDIKYYHFQYPGAANLLIAVDGKPVSFSYLLPSGIVCYEGSWTTSGSRFSIDGSKVASDVHYNIDVGFLTASQLAPDKVHCLVEYSGDFSLKGCGYGVAVVFVYK